MAKDPDFKATFCNQRWEYPNINFGRGDVRMCCRTLKWERITDEKMDALGTDIFLNSPDQIAFRKDMLAGILDEDCNACALLEEGGVKSARQYNLTLPYPWLTPEGSIDVNALEKATPITHAETKKTDSLAKFDGDSWLLKAHHPQVLEVSLGSGCDMKCSYCSPYESSSWEADVDLWALGVGRNATKPGFKEMIEERLKRNSNDPRFMELFWEWLQGSPIQSLKTISVIGGEPFISPHFPRFVEKLVEAYRGQKLSFVPNICITTNLNFTEARMDKVIQEFIPKLSEVFQVTILASIESVGPRAEYVRFGLDWNRFQENVHRVAGAGIKRFTFGFNPAINSLSITSLVDFLTFARSVQVKHGIPLVLGQNVVGQPAIQHPSLLTKDFAPHVEAALTLIEKITSEPMDELSLASWKGYCEFLKPIHESLEQERGKDVGWYDRGLDEGRIMFLRYFQEYDKRRGTNFLKTFPEYASFWNQCQRILADRKLALLGQKKGS